MKKRGDTIFSATPFLVTIDGPDGVGKSSFSEFLTQEVSKNIDPERAKLFRPTRFETTRESAEIRDELKKASKRIKPNSKTHNAFFFKDTRGKL